MPTRQQNHDMGRDGPTLGELIRKASVLTEAMIDRAGQFEYSGLIGPLTSIANALREAEKMLEKGASNE